LPAGLEGRADDRRQMRLVIDQQDAFGRAHATNELPRHLISSRCATFAIASPRPLGG
jgi:hypothetical protein